MKAYADTKPQPIEIDKITNGVARVLIRWNAKEVPAPVMDGEKARTQWEYDEEVIRWTLPTPDLTPDQIATYFKEKQAEVEGFAKAKQTNWKRTDGTKIDVAAAVIGVEK
jgi:hypothetical protein